MNPAETIEFWLNQPLNKIAESAAALTLQRRKIAEMAGYNKVMAFRECLALAYVSGKGAEVGAGDRPWPIGSNASCFYGDVRDSSQLSEYFNNSKVTFDGMLNAQTFEGIKDQSFDFVLSGHVIEHLPDPIGSIRETIRVLKSGGVFLLAVPDMRYTHDRSRPPTTFEHTLNDERDGGIGTRLNAYEEHVRYVHTQYHSAFPEEQILDEAIKISEAKMDIHWHAWDCNGFLEMLNSIKSRLNFRIEHCVSVENENIFVLKKN